MKTQELEKGTVQKIVRERYERIAEQGGSCGCAPSVVARSEPNRDEQ